MRSILAHGNGIKSLTVSKIVEELIDGRQVWIIESEVLMGDMLIQMLRDSMIQKMYDGKLKKTNYEKCLSRLYIYNNSTLPLSPINLKPLIITLSMAWSVEV